MTRRSQSSIHEVVLLSPSAKPSSNNNKHVDTISLLSTSNSGQQQQQHHASNSGSNIGSRSSPTSQWKTTYNGLTTPTTPPTSDSTKLCQATAPVIGSPATAATTNGCVVSGLTLPISPDTSRSCTPQSCSSVTSPPLPLGATESSSLAPPPGPPCSSRGFTRLDSQCSQTSSQSSDSHSQKAVGEDNSSNSASASTGECRWRSCKVTVDPTALTDHLKEQHVDTQTETPFKCQWEGCKVYNKESSSKAWLERHVATHSDNKPFKCIFEHCGMRFPSQYTLERHVQSHFNTYQPVLNKNGATTPSKLCKKKKNKRKYAYQGMWMFIFVYTSFIYRCICLDIVDSTV